MLHSADHCSYIVQSILGFSAAAGGTATLWLANATDAIPGWAQGGAYVGLVGGLSYGCITLWKALIEARHEAAEERREFIAAKDALEMEIRNDWKKQNSRLVAVLERLDKHTES